MLHNGPVCSTVHNGFYFEVFLFGGAAATRERLELRRQGRRGRGAVIGGKKKVLAPKAGASSVLDAAICSVAKGFWALSLPGNVRGFFSQPGSPKASLHPPARSKVKKLKKKKNEQCRDAFFRNGFRSVSVRWKFIQTPKTLKPLLSKTRSSRRSQK